MDHRQFLKQFIETVTLLVQAFQSLIGLFLVKGIFSKNFKGNIIQGLFMGRLKENLGCLTIIVGLSPSLSTQTPDVTLLQSWKGVVWHGGTEIIPHTSRVGQKLVSDLATDGMPT